MSDTIYCPHCGGWRWLKVVALEKDPPGVEAKDDVPTWICAKGCAVAFVNFRGTERAHWEIQDA